jgi:hypothetical protein
MCDSGLRQNLYFNPLTSNDLQRRRTVSPLEIKIPSKIMREKPTNTPIIHSLETFSEDGNVIPEHVGATIHN